MTSSRMGQKVRIRGGAAGSVMTAKVTGGSGSVSDSGTEFLLDPSGSPWWGTAWINASNEIVIPDLFPEFEIFDIHAGAEFTTASDASLGIVRVEYQYSSSLAGAFVRSWSVTKGWREINDARGAVEDVYMGLAFHDGLKEDYRVRFRLWNELDIDLNVVDAFISVASIAPDPEN